MNEHREATDGVTSAAGQGSDALRRRAERGDGMVVSSRGLHVGMIVQRNADRQMYRCVMVDGEGAVIVPVAEGNRRERRAALAKMKRGLA